MTVYIVLISIGPLGNSYIEKVFATEDLAEEFLENHKYPNKCRIEEYEIIGFQANCYSNVRIKIRGEK